MKAGWKTVTLDEVCEFLDRRGVTPEKLGSRFLSDGFRVISAKNIKGRQIDTTIGEQRFVDAPTYRRWMRSPLLADDVILTSEAPLGELAYVEEELEWCLGQRLFGIRTEKAKLNGRFLFHALQASPVRDDMLSRATGATAQGIRQTELKKVLLPLPSLPEQQRIVGVLDEAFAGLATAKANAEKNLQNARALFESHLQSVFTHRGDGWVDSTLGDVLAVIRNGMNCKQDKSGNGTKVSRIESIWNAEFDLTRVGYAEVPEVQRAKFRLLKGDVLFSHINSAIHVGKTAVFDEDEEVVHGVNLLLMRPKPELSPLFLDLYLKSIFAQGYWRRVCKQSINQASVNQQDISRVPIRFPGLKEQKTIVEQMANLRAETQRLAAITERKLAALEALKKSLLHQAFSGAL